MADPRINWGDSTTWRDVQAHVGANEPAPLWRRLLGLDDYVFIGEPGFNYDKFWGTATPGQPWGDLLPDAARGTADVARQAARVTGQAFQEGLSAAGDAAADAAGASFRAAAPWLVAGALAFLLYQRGTR